jgi:ankyrin repeat protein
VDEWGVSPLHEAAFQGYTEIVKLLLAAPGINVNSVDGTFGEPPLYGAAYRGHTEIVKLLLAAPGIDVNAAEGKEGHTPLYETVSRGHIEIVKLLLAAPGINVNPVESKEGHTPLHKASYDGNTEIVELLLDAGADVNSKATKGRTPLHEAARQGHTEIVKLLLEAGADVNTETTYRWTPLHWAAKRGHTEIVKLLLAAWADPVIQNKTGETALSLAKTDEIMYLLNPMGRLENVRPPVSIKDDLCAICLELLNSDKVVETSCGHQFHVKCLNNAKKRSSKCPICRKNKAFFGKRTIKKPKAKKVPKKLTLQANKFGIKLTVKRNGRRVRKTNLMKHIAMRKKVVGRPRKSLPFLKDIRKKTSFGKKPKAKKVPKKLTLQANKFGIKLTVKRNGRRVRKTNLMKHIAMRKKVVGRPRKSLPFLKDIRKKTSFGKKPKAIDKLKKTARKLGILVTTKRNGKRVYKPKSVLSKQIAVRKKMVDKKLKSFGRTTRRVTTKRPVSNKKSVANKTGLIKLKKIA